MAFLAVILSFGAKRAIEFKKPKTPPIFIKLEYGTLYKILKTYQWIVFARDRPWSYYQKHEVKFDTSLLNFELFVLTAEDDRPLISDMYICLFLCMTYVKIYSLNYSFSNSIIKNLLLASRSSVVVKRLFFSKFILLNF